MKLKLISIMLLLLLAVGGWRSYSAKGGESHEPRATSIGCATSALPGASQPNIPQVSSGEDRIRTCGRVLPLHRFSKPALSTTQPPLRAAQTEAPPV